MAYTFGSQELDSALIGHLQKVVRGGAQEWEETTEPVPSLTVEATREGIKFTRTFRIHYTRVGAFFWNAFPVQMKSVDIHRRHGILCLLKALALPLIKGLKHVAFEDGTTEPDWYLATVTYGPLDTEDPQNAGELSGISHTRLKPSIG